MRRAIVLLLLSVAAASAAGTADARIPSPFGNCGELNARYAHGVGKAGAADKTSGEPVKTFTRSTALYNRALSANGRLDGDRDGVACEKQ